jgi:hypothetical protein
MRFILTPILISLLVSGCSTNPETIGAKTDINKLKRKACDDWAIARGTGTEPMPLRVAILFQEIAEQDEKYIDLSKAAFYMAIIGKSENNLLNELKPKYFESIAEVFRHCTSNEFLNYVPSPTPSPSGS